MKAYGAMITIVVASASPLFGQTAESAYAGEQKREIKSLSADEVQNYLSGHGMGFAKAAELNQYPGPKHVIELAKELELTRDQQMQTEQIYAEMHKEATRLGKIYVDLEKELDRMFAERRTRENLMRNLILGISRVRGEIRLTHLNAHLRMAQVLRSSQIAKYDALRGYTDASLQPGHQPRHKH
ncbi:hypothetical protein MJD09_04985 [bacterium]|nr:hypothetical protein [bacterium]